METKPTYEELELHNARIADQLAKALHEMIIWRSRALGAESRIEAASKQIDHEITLLQQPIHFR